MLSSLDLKTKTSSVLTAFSPFAPAHFLKDLGLSDSSSGTRCLAAITLRLNASGSRTGMIITPYSFHLSAKST